MYEREKETIKRRLENHSTSNNMKEVKAVEISRAEESNVVSIWLTGEDQKDEQCMAELPGLIKAFAKEGLLPVVFRSGKEPLYDMTRALLKYNRDWMAEQNK